LLSPDLQTYRGLSGLDTAFFVLFGVSAVCTFYRERRWIWLMVITCLVACLVGKTTFEILSSRALFVDTCRSRFAPVPMAHVLGGVVGFVIGLLPKEKPLPINQ